MYRVDAFNAPPPPGPMLTQTRSATVSKALQVTEMVVEAFEALFAVTSIGPKDKSATERLQLCAEAVAFGRIPQQAATPAINPTDRAEGKSLIPLRAKPAKKASARDNARRAHGVTRK
jgi:hypothetical protein